ncbi:MAG: cysteine-rich CWC family protein [Gammaproteobacteria bacterium]|nr:cysteine-rich CWC family protein [Gammaproteobacteria bacterium]
MTHACPTDKLCPLCGGDNACAIANGQAAESCWCWNAGTFDAALAALPQAERGQRCICALCALPAHTDHKETQ